LRFRMLRLRAGIPSPVALSVKGARGHWEIAWTAQYYADDSMLTVGELLHSHLRGGEDNHFLWMERTMLVPIPGLGIVHRCDQTGAGFVLHLEGVPAALRPQDVLPTGERAAFAVWQAVLGGGVRLDEPQIDVLAQFIAEGM
jgi:hypothetical protein